MSLETIALFIVGFVGGYYVLGHYFESGKPA